MLEEVEGPYNSFKNAKLVGDFFIHPYWYCLVIGKGDNVVRLTTVV